MHTNDDSESTLIVLVARERRWVNKEKKSWWKISLIPLLISSTDISDDDAIGDNEEVVVDGDDGDDGGDNGDVVDGADIKRGLENLMYFINSYYYCIVYNE